MKRWLMATSAFGIVLGLLITSIVMAVEDENEPRDDDIDAQGIDGYLDLEDISVDLSEWEEEGTVDEPRFAPLVRRAYAFLGKGFVSTHSEWEKLPPVRSIFTADSPGEWMHDALPRINATGEARIVDRDGDGYPELVIWKHYQTIPNASITDLNATGIETSDILASTNLSHVRFSWTRGFTLIYIDRDGDVFPERVQLGVVHELRVPLDSARSPRVRHSFHWMGAVLDRGSDGKRDVERFNTRTSTAIDLDGDGCYEMRRHHEANYLRADSAGGPGWDRITARYSAGSTTDRNSDGSPELRESRSFSGRWDDRNGNGWPGLIRISSNGNIFRDGDSDGYPEYRDRTSSSLLYEDRNDDANPEIVRISWRKVAWMDRDSDGRVDLIRTHTRLFLWIDRDSDGVPERVVRENMEEEIRPGTGRADDRTANGKNGTSEDQEPRREPGRDPEVENGENERQQTSRK